jgi:hypothetical protein
MAEKTFRNGSGMAKTGGRSKDSSKALMNKIAEHLMLPYELKTGCQLHFRFRSYGGKTLPGWPKLVEGAEIAHMFMKQICRALHATHWIEIRMSVALPVPEKWRENTSVLAKQVGAQIVYKLMKQTLQTYSVFRFLILIPEFVRSSVSMFSSVS